MEAELHIAEMAPSGEAVAITEIDGERRAVLVPGAAPDEIVRVRFDPSKRPARGSLLEIVAPSASRAEPPCPFVAMCGGCDWMHLARDAQRAAHVALSMRVANGAPIVFHAASSALGYRLRGRLHARVEKSRTRVGFFAARSHDIVDVAACVVLDPRLDAARAPLAALLAGVHGDGEIHLALGRPGDATARVIADITWSRDLPTETYARLDAATRTAAPFSGIRIRCGEARRASLFGDPAPWIPGPDGAPLELALGGFSQAHGAVNTALAARVAELVSYSPGRRVVELYAGAGNLTVLLARDHDVRAVESSEEACEAARRNLRARSLEARVTCADVDTYELPATDVVVLDPPRSGAREVCERLAHSRVKRVVYVSCDRATLARDVAAIMAVGSRFVVTSVDVFEMFPHTSHAETVVTLDRQ